jgi:hypothetical protein
MVERGAQVLQPAGLPDDVGMERDAHDQRRGVRLHQHPVEVVCNLGELARAESFRTKMAGMSLISWG